VQAEDLITDDLDGVDINGAHVRKGTVAAFAHNALTLERADADSAEYGQALADPRDAIPVLSAAGMFEVFSVRAPTAAGILEEYDPARLPRR
jgi:hypothetical protein